MTLPVTLPLSFFYLSFASVGHFLMEGSAGITRVKSWGIGTAASCIESLRSNLPLNTVSAGPSCFGMPD